MKKQNLVVIGNGMVGQKLLDQLAESGATARYAITVLCEEPRPAYDRVQLTAYFSGSSAADLALVEQTFFYDKLVLATGSYPFVPSVPGATATTASSIAPSRIWRR
jgi:nitrite reductase (NADH) large subunit